MQNNDLAEALDQIGTLIELNEDNPFRARAYHNAARTVQGLEDDVADLQASGRLASVPGLGKEMRAHIAEWLETGQITLLNDLLAVIPPGLVDMLRIPGLGPKRIRTLHQMLGIATLEDLAAACRDGRVAAISGFGPKTQANILKGIEFVAQQASAWRYPEGYDAAQAIIAALRQAPGIVRVSEAGSVRRRKEIVHDLDVVAGVASDADRAGVMEALVTMPRVTGTIERGDTRTSVRLENGMQVDLRVVADDEFATALHHFTGSKEHNIALRGMAHDQGIKINEYGIWRGDERLPVRTEAEFYAVFGVDEIPPEMREDRGEIQAALAHALPVLVTEHDIVGALHCHSTWSDGHASIRDMALACQRHGWRYLGMTDHSQVAAYAHGLTPEDVRRQQKEIDALNAEFGDAFRILKGTECDILKDGSLDYDDETLASFDFVVASIHSSFNMTEAEATARLIRAIENPYVTIIGHLTGRLLLQREGYPVNVEAVIEAAGKRGVAIELNANPARFDLDWRWHRMATEHGVPVPIDTDAHTPAGLNDMALGIGIARKGWLRPQDVPNAWPLDKLQAWLAGVRERGLRRG
jgi:DNA polymerase (family 10)